MPPKKEAPKNALALYDERLAQIAKNATQAVSKVGSAGNFISLKGGNLTYQSAAIPGNTMRVIIIDAICENQFYIGAFDPEGFASPACYAFGRDPGAMAPNPEHVASPINATCKGCPNNEWGSADVGRGKACKEVFRLAMITEAGMEDIEKAEVAFMKVPVTSAKHWAGYVRDLAAVYKRSALVFVTEVSLVRGANDPLPGWHVEFKMVEPIDTAEAFEALLKRYEDVSKTIEFPYPKAEDRPKPAPKAARAAAPPAVARAAAGKAVKVGARR